MFLLQSLGFAGGLTGGLYCLTVRPNTSFVCICRRVVGEKSFSEIRVPITRREPKAGHGARNGIFYRDLLGSATTPLSSHGSQFLMALEGEQSRGISKTPLAFRDFPSFPFSFVSRFIRNVPTFCPFVLVIAI